MGFTTELTFTVECEDCPTEETYMLSGGECGIQEEESQEIIDFMYRLEFFEGWELVRECYEEHKFYCPQCKKKREAAQP